MLKRSANRCLAAAACMGGLAAAMPAAGAAGAADVLNMQDVYDYTMQALPYLIPFFAVLAATIVLWIAMRKKSRAVKRLVRGESVLACILTLALGANLICLNPLSNVMSLVFAVPAELSAETKAESEALIEEISGEGIVLLENDGLLPLAQNTRLNVFGWASTNPCYGGTGSGAVDTSTAVTLLDGLENAGFELNTELSDFYVSYRSDRPRIARVEQDWTLPEPMMSEYPQELLDSARDFSDTALIVITRVGGEGADLPTDVTAVTYEGNPGDFTEGQTLLELSKTEREMVDYVTSTYENVVVVYNSANAFELGWVEEYDNIGGVVTIAGPGQTGFNALGSVLNGTVNPSGRLVDTWVYDLTSINNFNNIGDFRYTNMEEFGTEENPIVSFVHNVEGIYVGYKFYETADEEGFLDYDAAVQYPFGYGLSYTQFTQEMGAMTADGDGNLIFDVTVTNTGDQAGKDVVEVYYTPPYYNGGIEKASVNLIDFAKTDLLEPGESQTVSFSIALEDMASYDSYGHGCYVLEHGDYTVSIRSDSHTVLAQQTYTLDEDIVYGEDNPRSTDQAAAQNLFQWIEGDVTYLSRADGFANYEEATAGPSSYEMPEEYKAVYVNNSNYDPFAENDPSDVAPVMGEDNGLTMKDMYGLDYDDPLWEDMLDQLTVEDMRYMISSGGYQGGAISHIGKVYTVDVDGPAGLSSFFNGNSGTAFPCATLIACTWNKDLAYERGSQIGQEARELGVNGWYGPAMNIHRSAFSGRNFEYYSEDGMLTGYMAAAETKGAQDKGVYCYIKHFALNDLEQNRENQICVWSTEQAARELYLKGFEMAVKEGGATAVMSALNYIGTQWTGSCSALLNDLLRGEWGFQGVVVTDSFAQAQNYKSADRAIRNGGDMMLSSAVGGAQELEDYTSATSLNYMRTACHNILYTFANGYEYSGEVAVRMEPWKMGMIVIDVVLAAALAAGEILLLKGYRKNRGSL